MQLDVVPRLWGHRGVCVVAHVFQILFFAREFSRNGLKISMLANNALVRTNNEFPFFYYRKLSNDLNSGTRASYYLRSAINKVCSHLTRNNRSIRVSVVPILMAVLLT